MKKIITLSALFLCFATNLDAQTKDSSAKRKTPVDHTSPKNKAKTNNKQRSEDRITRRDSALALPPEEESRRSPSSAIPPNTPQ